MTDYGTIKIPREEYEQHNERREAMGVTWAEYIDGEASEVDPQGAAVPEDLREQLDRIEAAVQAAEDRASSIERTVEDMEGRMR